MVAIVLTDGSAKRVIFTFFDNMPDDARLKEVMQSIASLKAHSPVSFGVNPRSLAKRSLSAGTRSLALAPSR